MERILAQSVRASTRPVPSSSIPIHLVFFFFRPPQNRTY
jgi:hypothetical protein